MMFRVCKNCNFILIILPAIIISGAPAAESEKADADSSGAVSFEPLPIVSYDTNTGIGYGVKSFLLNAFKNRESFDLVLFNSTRGERWYHLVFSVPDFELRQGRKYPFSLDLILDYDRWITYHFYGIGNQSHYQDEEKYTRRLFETAFMASRGFSGKFVGQIGLRYRNIANSAIPAGSKLFSALPSLNQGTAEFLCSCFNLRYDSRDSYINPAGGRVLQLEAEIVPARPVNRFSCVYWAAWYQYYTPGPLGKTTLAWRAGARSIIGHDLPIQVLIPVGGGNTLRGYSQDRFLDKFSLLFNLEIRFTVYKRLGAVAGLDCGKVWSGPGRIDLKNWPWNWVAGLRYYRHTYVVRLDLGISREIIGLYINFGHVF